MSVPDTLCSVVSLEKHEPLEGSASRTEVWLMLEYNGPWQSKAFDASELPEAVKTYLSIFLKSQANSRLVLIRQPAGGMLREDGWLPNLDKVLSFYVGLACAENPVLYGFRLETYEDLLSIDLVGLVTYPSRYTDALVRQPLWMVCTNGRRDRCCALHGVGVYAALTQSAHARGIDGQVWQCTHLGGHRFAANVVSFPNGIYYGRVEPAEAEKLVGLQLSGEALVEKMRGRACYEDPAQVAEILLLRHTGQAGLGDFHLESLSEAGPNAWKAAFTSASGARYSVSVIAEDTGEQVLQGCSSSKRLPVIRYSGTVLASGMQAAGGRAEAMDTETQKLASPLAMGRTAEVYAWEAGQVLKLFRSPSERSLMEGEARVSRLVQAVGLPVPRFYGEIEAAGRPGLVYERVEGESLLSEIKTRPWRVPQAARQLARLHAALHGVSGEGLLPLNPRLAQRIRSVDMLPTSLRAAALVLLKELPEGKSLCHGDFHPDNILVTARGPVIIDWADATQGRSLADVARTSLLLQIGRPPKGTRMVWVIQWVRGWFHLVYMKTYAKLRPYDYTEFHAWANVVAAARLAERIPEEQDRLMELLVEAFS